jgi:hypothetical protein
MLYGGAPAQATWYRVANSGYDPTTGHLNVNLVGVDWNGGAAGINALIIPSVTGVYTTTVQLDNDAIWSQ